MPIDEPIESMQTLNENDERQRSPVSEWFLKAFSYFEPILSIAAKGNAPTAAATAFLKTASYFKSRRDARNQKEFTDVLAAEVNDILNRFGCLASKAKSTNISFRRSFPPCCWTHSTGQS